MCPLPIPNKTQNIFGGWGALIPSPKAVGLECSPTLHSVVTSIACSLVVTKLISNSCAPLPTRLREIKKIAKVPRLLPYWDSVISFVVNGKVQNKQGYQCPFLGVNFIVFPAFLLAPSHPHKGSVVFSEH